MPRPKQRRRHASLPLPPNVTAALRNLRRSFAALNSAQLLDDLPYELIMQMLCSIARELATNAIHLSYALSCSIEEQNQPPSTTVEG